jgi:LacI family transcriptional regulator
MLTDDFVATPPLATVRDIASAVGVSPATVSRVLNDNASVAPHTRDAVLRAMRRSSFTRRPRGSSAHSRGFIALRCPYILTDYFGVLVSAIAESLRQRGKRIFLSAGDDNEQPRLSALRLPENTEGAILVLPSEPSTVLADLRASSYPFVVVGARYAVPADVAAVSVANMAGARAATEHLIQLGHERIATICGPLDWLSSDGRLMGYRAALATAGQLPPDEFVRVGGDPTIDNGLEAARALLGLPRPPTAILAYNDKMAVGALRAAAERGLNVPRDLSIVGFDALEMSQASVPRLTTVRQPIEEMARISVELLVSLLERREVDTAHVVLATELVVGGSSGPPPSSPT